MIVLTDHNTQLKMNLEHMNVTDGLMGLSMESSSAMKRSKIKALIDLAGDAESIHSTLSYLGEMVNLFIVYHRTR